MAQKFGYDSVEDLYKKSQNDFSLVSNGIVERPSTRLLLVNVGILVDFVRCEHRIDIGYRVPMTASCPSKIQ